MRVTTNAGVNPFLSHLESIQTRKYKNEIREASGQQNISLTDGPKEIVQTKQLSELINRNEKYLSNINIAYYEMQAVEQTLNDLQEEIADIRQLAVDSTQTGNMGNLDTLSSNVKGYLNDFIRKANSDYNGKFLFAGTETHPGSLDNTNYPFEFIEGEPTADNPSGFEIVFHGNMKERAINKDSATDEVINITAEQIFGANGTEAIEAVIGLYNTYAFTEDGRIRTKDDALTITDTAKLNSDQKKLGDFSDKIAKANSINGSRINRMEAVRAQLEEENVRLKGVRSNYADADYARVALELAKDSAALNYALKIGSQIMNNSLFDFLS